MTKEDISVLVVDDDPEMLEMMQALLEVDGYRVVTADSAEEAMSAIAVEKPFCVICDLGLPAVSDGLELARCIRAEHGPDLVLIALTGVTETEHHEAAETAGVDYVLHKPLDIGRLQQMLPPVEKTHTHR